MPHSINIPGQKVSQGSYSAFLPAALPPKLNWTPRLIGALSDADRLVGRLAGEGTRAHTFGQWAGVYCRGVAEVAEQSGHEDVVHRAWESVGERVLRELQREVAR